MAKPRARSKDLEARLQRGEDFGMLAQNYSEDPNSAPNGGDMGLIPESNLERSARSCASMVIVALPPDGVLSRFTIRRTVTAF